MSSARRQSLILPIMASLIGHIGVAGMFGFLTLVMTFCGDSKRIIDPDDTIEVAMVALPKSKTSMPDRATRAPEPVGTEAPPPPEPPPDVKHTSDLVVKTKKAQPKPGVDTKRLEDAMKRLEQEQKAADMNAALGKLTQSATDPDGDPENGMASGAIGTPSDPEYARYIALVVKTFNEQFHPLAAVRDANPNLKCVIHVQVEPGTGRIVRYDVSKPSGIEAFDAAARRAVEAITVIPLPPEKYRDRMARGYDIEFK